MMVTATVIGLSAGKRLMCSSSYYSDLVETLSGSSDHGLLHQVSSAKNVITAKKSSNWSPSFSTSQCSQSIKALKEDVQVACGPSNEQQWHQRSYLAQDEGTDPEYLVEALLLLQKSILEKQLNLSIDQTMLTATKGEESHKKMEVTSSGISARQRRIDVRMKIQSRRKSSIKLKTSKQLRSVTTPELLQSRLKGYVKGVTSEELLTHPEVVQLSEKIKIGLFVEAHKSRLKERLGCEPTDEQLESSLRISSAELQSKMIKCSLAKEKLAMSNVRLVMSIAQRYDNMGTEMADLVQGGLIGLLRGIDKFDSSKGFKISTYVYWWIRQGVSRVLVENSRTLRLPTHLHERLSMIRNAKTRLEEKGITPSINRIAESLNMSQKKVRNATEAISKVFSLDREAFPSLNGLPGETLHSYIADDRLENIPWHGVDGWALKDEINNLICTTLSERERDIIRLYYGLDNECLTWEDISKRIGLSRERVRQVGLVAFEKLKHAARKAKLETMLLKH